MLNKIWLNNKIFLSLLSLLTLVSFLSPLGVQAQLRQTPLAQKKSEPRRISQLIFRPPNRGSPARTSGGATRSTASDGATGARCLTGEKTLSSLIPPQSLPLTVAEHPTFFWYVPPSTARLAEFILLDQEYQIVYETTFALPDRSGIVSFSLPTNELPPLKTGKMYHWFFALLCNTEDQSRNPFVDGWIERTEISPTLKQRIEQVAPSERPALYAEAGIWQDALTSLVELKLLSPNDLTLTRDWKELLQSVELDAIADEPLVTP